MGDQHIFHILVVVVVFHESFLFIHVDVCVCDFYPMRDNLQLNVSDNFRQHCNLNFFHFFIADTPKTWGNNLLECMFTTYSGKAEKDVALMVQECSK